MSTSERPQKISIGFHGGQVLAARVKAEPLAALRRALAAEAPGWHELTAEEGAVVLHLGRVDYVLVENEEHRVGFSSSVS
jgi:hypothetical protein